MPAHPAEQAQRVDGLPDYPGDSPGRPARLIVVLMPRQRGGWYPELAGHLPEPAGHRVDDGLPGGGHAGSRAGPPATPHSRSSRPRIGLTRQFGGYHPAVGSCPGCLVRGSRLPARDDGLEVDLNVHRRGQLTVTSAVPDPVKHPLCQVPVAGQPVGGGQRRGPDPLDIRLEVFQVQPDQRMREAVSPGAGPGWCTRSARP